MALPEYFMDKYRRRSNFRNARQVQAMQAVPNGLMRKPQRLRDAGDDSVWLTARAKRSDCVEVNSHAPMKRSSSHRERGVFRHQRTIDLPLERPYSRSQPKKSV